MKLVPLLSVLLLGSTSWAAQSNYYPQFIPSDPTSAYYEDFRDPASSFSILSASSAEPDLGFCAEWNPEFPLNGYRCCAKTAVSYGKKRRKPGMCWAERRKTSYCGEMTEEQRLYASAVASGVSPDVLSLISNQRGRHVEQSYCTVNNGFLAFGRPLIATSFNRIVLRSPQRCVNFGSDPMIGMLEWTGRQLATAYSSPEYAGVKLVVGDISAPRGGCLPGRVGRRGHASHTTGQDVDLAFLEAKPYVESASAFGKQFDGRANWWLVKQLFKNPYACIKVIFLDRSLIRKLGKAAGNDPEWPVLSRFLRHVRNHRNHYHVRIGSGPGQPGCSANAHPELETDDEGTAEPDFPFDGMDTMPGGEPKPGPVLIQAGGSGPARKTAGVQE